MKPAAGSRARPFPTLSALQKLAVASAHKTSRPPYKKEEKRLQGPRPRGTDENATLPRSYASWNTLLRGTSATTFYFVERVIYTTTKARGFCVGVFEESTVDQESTVSCKL